MSFKKHIKAKKQIMETLEKAIDEVFDQLDANIYAELTSDINQDKSMNTNLFIDKLNAKLFFNVNGENSIAKKNFEMYCNPVVNLKANILNMADVEQKESVVVKQ